MASVTPEEARILSDITFEWAESLDTKDWDRLRAILAPTLFVDYSKVTGQKWDEMSTDEFLAIFSDKTFLDDPLVDLQHLIGLCKYEKTSDTEIFGDHQIRAAHQRYTIDKNTAEVQGHGYGLIRHYYKKLDGHWKLAGLRPTMRWVEGSFSDIFRDKKS
ncbi:Scytalone dehydratase [Microthyrium microscopicum]|uniref:Scytalone dehydratase n=1 Tax=Microthyrium microscopicum TaxID=703497 RepID=A0A6A6U754_9PEZI|nr:Scytalone dehydratase [Microthyrium microscopicum]